MILAERAARTVAETIAATAGAEGHKPVTRFGTPPIYRVHEGSSGTDMLITIAAALIAALATPSGADAPPDTVEARCGVVAIWGETFQRMNQNGTSMVDALESAARMAEPDPEIGPVLRAIVITAYSNTKRFDTLEFQDTAVANFRKGLHAACLTRFGG
jgi:hypothetical protein